MARLALLSLLSLAVPACAASTATTDDGASSDEAVSKAGTPTLTDAQLAAALATSPGTLTTAEADKLALETVYPVATTKRLKLLNDFIAAGKTDPYGVLAAQMEGIYWGSPRDLTSTPAAFGAQKFETAVAGLGDQGLGSPTTLKVTGTAKNAYTLHFTVANTQLTAHVPAGATASKTASIIGDAIQASIQTVEMNHDSLDSIGGDHADSKSGIDDIEVSVSGATVQVLVALNG